MWLLDKMLRRLVRRGELVIVDHDGREYRYGAPDPEVRSVTVRLTDRRAAMHIARDPAIGAGEAYMDGRLVMERGDIRDLIYFVRINGDRPQAAFLTPPSPLRRAANGILGRIDRINYRRRARRNAAHSYDIGNSLFELFLDEDMQYTCAYWRTIDATLERAQLEKKAHIAAKLNLKPGLKLLDIGCGWGGMALYLHKVTGCEVHGIALAEEQIKVARQRAEAQGVADKVTFEVLDYRDITGRYDRIVNVGLLEHIGPPHYEQFFRKCHDLLPEDGVMLSHFIGRLGPPGVTDRWTSKYIFPGGYIPSLSEVVSVTEKLNLKIADVEVLRRHYGYTLEHWYRRTVEHRDEIVALYDERFYRMWLFYLAGAETAFHHSGLINYQIQFVRHRDTLPITRDYMRDAEERLLGRDRPPRAEPAAEMEARAGIEPACKDLQSSA